MKKLLLIFLLASTITIYSQTPPKGSKELKVEEKIEGEYSLNVTDKGLSPAILTALNKRVPGKLKKYGFNDIKIEEIGKIENSSNTKFQVNLINNETGEYYKIRLNMSYSPIYIIKELDGGYCSLISEEKDKFTSEITYTTPLLDQINFIKVKKDGSVNTFMKLMVIGSTANVGKKGAIILFEDGSKLEKPEVEISSNVNKNGRGFIYDAFIKLTDEDIKKLTISKVTDIRLYIYDSEIKDGIKYREYIKCIKEI